MLLDLKLDVYVRLVIEWLPLREKASSLNILKNKCLFKKQRQKTRANTFKKRKKKQQETQLMPQ